MKKKLAAIFAGISLLIFFPEKSSASISRANIIGKWECKESTYYDWGTLVARSETDIREDGIGYASATASFFYNDEPPRNYKIMATANWSYQEIIGRLNIKIFKLCRLAQIMIRIVLI